MSRLNIWGVNHRERNWEKGKSIWNFANLRKKSIQARSNQNTQIWKNFTSNNNLTGRSKLSQKSNEILNNLKNLEQWKLAQSSLCLSNTSTSNYRWNMQTSQQKSMFFMKNLNNMGIHPTDQQATDDIKINQLKKTKLSFMTRFSQQNIGDFKTLYKRLNRACWLIDIYCCWINVIVITSLYFSHFEYNNNNYSLNQKENNWRIICLILTISVIISLVVRACCKRRLRYVKYVLNLRPTIPSDNISVTYLIIESFIHLLQSYPYVEWNFSINIVGTYVTYSLDMITFCLSLLRLYVVIKVIKVWNNYTNTRGEKIFNFYMNFSIKNTNKKVKLFYLKTKLKIIHFLYKTSLKNQPFSTILIIFFVFLIVGGYILKIVENYQNGEAEYIFGNWFNCIWYLLQTMTQIGYGEIIPFTWVGRVIASIVGFTGIFLWALFTVVFYIFTTIIEENEYQTFNEINLVYTKEDDDNSYSIYFNQYIKYKIKQLATHFKPAEQWNKAIQNRNKMKIFKEKYLEKVLASTQIPSTLLELCYFVTHSWEPEMEECIVWYKDRINVIKQFNDFICRSLLSYRKNAFDVNYSNNKLLNLMHMITWLGKVINMKDEANLIKYKIITIDEFIRKFKEFHVWYWDTYDKYQKKKQQKVSKYSSILNCGGIIDWVDFRKNKGKTIITQISDSEVLEDNASSDEDDKEDSFFYGSDDSEVSKSFNSD